MNSELSPKEIVIAGDVTIDWNLIFFQSAQDTTTLWNANNLARACPQPGGAALLAHLIETSLTNLGEAHPVRIHALQVSETGIHPADEQYNHSYAIWELLGEKEQKGWRVSRYLGIDPAHQIGEGLKLADDPDRADLVVLDDACLGFRDHPELWPKVLKNSSGHPWVILKLSYPIANNGLLSHLIATCADRLIIVVTANDLRLANAQISRGLSWERVAQDTLWELSYGSEMKELARSAHVVVSFRTDGAVLISRTGTEMKCKLFFDPNTIENVWETGFKGGMVGYNTCLATAIARSVVSQASGDPTCQAAVEKGIKAGLSAMRVLQKNGYQNGGSKPHETKIAFPYHLVAADIEKPGTSFAQSDIRDPLGVLVLSNESPASPRTGKFTILAQQCCDDLLKLARDIVRKGPDKTLTNIPLGRFGNLLTVDRNEIESYRTIAALVQEYISQEKADKPISIAVFGAPGSGKSFGIKEIAKSINKDRIKDITFNLSQMNSPEDLIGALHQVRDESLRGRIPLVFWDEFDTSLNQTPLGWLRYFLAPMQDGSFLEGQVTHPIGKAIFVFAGGTCKRMEEFGTNLDDETDKNEKIFKAVKGPDFKSRLKGFINILGPNPQEGTYDPYFIIRRAILLNSILHRTAPQIFSSGFHMEDNLLDAFLETHVYLHGVRSMESIVTMSQLSGKTRFERSCLPPISQLNLHVIGWEFMARIQKLKFEGDSLDKLARAVHEDFCEYMSEKGYVKGPLTDDKSNPPTHCALIPYNELPEGDRIQNEQNALSIPDKLARCGYVMIHARTNEPPLTFPDKDLDLLAEEEHNRWVKAKIAQDSRWHYAPETCKAKFEHNCLLPWKKVSEDELAQVFSAEERAVIGREELPEAEKNKDRKLIQRIPNILARVGYTVIKLGDSD
jgi:hypothetical protein